MHLLDITDNKIGSLQNLCKHGVKILLVSDNKIKDISSVCELIELKIFDFSNNKVVEFDQRIKNLKKLKCFSGPDNKITDFDIFFLLDNKKSISDSPKTPNLERQDFTILLKKNPY